MSEEGIKPETTPKSFVFGDGIDWCSPLVQTFLYVELPFWLMIPPGSVDVRWSGVTFTVDVCPSWMEVFVGEVTDSRKTCFHQGPWSPEYVPPQGLAEELTQKKASWMSRHCKTVLRLNTRAHSSAFRTLSEDDLPRARTEQEVYWASLCEEHIPVINELIQRYRLVTYDYFAYEVSAWDVPVWYLKHAEDGYRALLLPCKSWDEKPVAIEYGKNVEEPPKVHPFQWATLAELAATSSDAATPGEFDLLDARSLMERGDYTGAVRRTVTAIEAVLSWALLSELEKRHDHPEAMRRLSKTDNNFPGRLAQWQRLAQPQISQRLVDEFKATRGIRHDIVHRSLRLVHNDRGKAQRAVDTGRWLYNQIEGKPGRARLRDYGALKSAGRVTVAIRFPAKLDANGLTLGSISDLINADRSS